jgi:hypothetical protein
VAADQRSEAVGMPIEGPPPIYEGGDHRHLGPDPEPLGERFDELMWRERAGRLAAPPAECPLERAFGRRRACTGRACVFFRVPGVDSACAPLQWSPNVADDRVVAGWYTARRVEAASARALKRSAA